MVNRNHVANKAGVSVATVSRVFNGVGYVTQEKRDLVIQAAQELGYKPDPVAISLKLRRTHQLMYYIRDLDNNYYAEMYKGLMDYVRNTDYSFIISGDLNYDQINSLMIDGIVLPTEFFASVEFIGGLRIPAVTAGHGQKKINDDHHVIVDTGDAMKMALNYLRAKGHERIAYASINVEALQEARQVSFMELMSDTLGDRLPEYVFGPSLFSETKDEIDYFKIGAISARQFILRRMDITAFACFNDTCALGFISGLYGSGIRVPDDVSVIGFDGHIGAEYANPPLTTISLEPFRHGRECARVLIEQIEGRSRVSEPIPIRLIERQSVRDIRASGPSLDN